jgi:hypothetical protein
MTKEEAARIAAAWWTNEIANNSMSQGLTEQQLSDFQGILEEKINDWLKKDEYWEEDERTKGGTAHRVIFVDYKPNLLLKSAAEQAGIDKSLFPIKTFMWLDPDGVRVSLGYGAPLEVVTVENTKNRENIYAAINWQEIE